MGDCSTSLAAGVIDCSSLSLTVVSAESRKTSEFKTAAAVHYYMILPLSQIYGHMPLIAFGPGHLTKDLGWREYLVLVKISLSRYFAIENRKIVFN